MPAVTVIVPNYNHAAFIAQRLESILQQTFTDFEVIILDDASTDNSLEIISRYTTDARFRVVTNKANSGSPFVQWNKGIQMASGEFVWIAESDDFAEPNFLATLLPMLRDHPEVGLAHSQSRQVDPEGRVAGTLEEWVTDMDPAHWKESFIRNGKSECEDFLIWRNTIPNASAVLLRKETYIAAGGAPSDMRLCGDWMIWMKMLMISDIGFTPEPLNYFRMHKASVRENTGFFQFLDERWRVQLFGLRAMRLTRAAKKKLALRLLDDLMARIRIASSFERIRQLLHGVALFWPLFATVPFAVIGSGFRHVLQLSSSRNSG